MDNAADAIIDLYRRRAIAWTDARGTQLVERAWLDRFCALLPAGADILDIGCGAGLPVARHLRDQGYRVTGIDSAPEMIALFERNVAGAEAHVGDMRTLDLRRRFDGLIAWDSFFHLRPGEQRAMFPVFRAHAAPRAALMFTTGPAHGEAIGVLEGEPLYHASLDPAAYRALLDEHGFAVVEQVSEDPACGGHTVWLARSR